MRRCGTSKLRECLRHPRHEERNEFQINVPGRRHQAANCQKRGRRCVAVFQAALRQAKRLSVNRRYTVSGIMPNVRFGSLADMARIQRDVRFYKADIVGALMSKRSTL